MEGKLHTPDARSSEILNAKAPKIKKEKLKSNHIKTSKEENSPPVIPGR